MHTFWGRLRCKLPIAGHHQIFLVHVEKRKSKRLRNISFLYILIIIKLHTLFINVRTVDITVISSTPKILFYMTWHLIPDIFVIISSELDIISLIRENHNLCQTAKFLNLRLEAKIEECEIKWIGRREVCSSTAKLETVKDYVTILVTTFSSLMQYKTFLSSLWFAMS